MLVQVGSRYVNTDHIVSIEDTPTGRSAMLVTGKSIPWPIGALDPDDLCGAIVPAPSGMMLVEALLPAEGDDDRVVRYRMSTVRAFRITDVTAAPVPIGGFGEPTTRSNYEYAVLQPDGQCFGWERIWDSLDAFKAEQQAEADAQREPSHPSSSEPASNRSQPAPPAARHRTDRSRTFSAGAETVEQIRARILAEPIKALTPDAPWRTNRDLTEVIAAVRDAYPDLHTKGLGYRSSWGWKWGPGDQDRDRAEMTSAGLVHEFERALRFLSYAGQRFPQAKINHRRTSYSWKHAAERVMGDYISNGMLVAAAYALGFKVAANPDSPNPCINLDEKAALLDPDRGL
jgi:hypothetical protein